jgi:uncharacterized membrane protein
MLLALAAAARLWTLGVKNIWLDEVASWVEASYPIARMLESVAGDIHPPLYYLMLKGWIALAGDGPIALRFPSVVFGVLVVFLSWFLARRWLRPSTRIAAGAWIAISPHLVFYSQEARMYAPAAAAVLAACLAYRRWIESRFRSTAALLAFTLSASVALYLHYFTALAGLALTIHLLIAARGHRRAWIGWLTAHAVILLAYMPWVPAAAEQIARGQPWRQSVGFLEIPRYLAVMTGEFMVGYHLQWSLVLTVALGLIAFVLIRGWVGLVALIQRRTDERDLWLGLLCGVPVIVSLLALPLTGHMGLSRYLAYLPPLFVIAAARGLDAWPASSDRRRAALLTAGTLASALCLMSYYRDPLRDFDVRPAVRALAAEAAGSDRGVAVVDPAFMEMCLKYYARQPPVRFQPMPPGESIWKMLTDVARAHPERLWVVLARDGVRFDAAGVPDGFLLEEVTLQPSHPDRIRLLRVIKTP